MTPNCKDCRYRYWLARLCDTHVDYCDCDRLGTDLCVKMNDPKFIEFTHSLDGPKPDHIPQETWDRLKENFNAIYEDEEE